jgi:hypothetical protein
MTSRLLAAAALLCFSSQPAAVALRPQPPQKGEIYGTVFAPDARTVEGARVSVKGVHSHKHWEDLSNEMGEFYIYVPAGAEDYDIEVTARGFAPGKATVHIYNAEKETIFIKLQQAAK